ncbi:response regulator transcription factor [Candidatus Sumerlaeota bacterium]|nr:response regulator transcription factor [Candidatus Sumerlaeota bacterium]
MKILIAEDDATSRLVLDLTFKKESFETVSAADGEVACRLVSEDPTIDMAVLDWMMPVVDGLEVCQRIRAIRKTDPIYVIILTTRDEKQDVIQGLNAGADDYMSKPFDRAELLARVRVGERVVSLQRDLNRRIRSLEEARDHIQVLQEIVPFCMHCHKIRTDKESWERIETYIEKNSGTVLSHGLCPECLEKFYPDSDA